MDDSKHKLKVVSYVIIALAIFNAIMLGIGWKNGELREEVQAKLNQSMTENEVTEEEVEQMGDTLLDVTFYSTIGITVLGILFKIYLGVKGLHQANGKIKGKGNIVWAKIIFICSIISIALSIMPLIRGEISIPSFTSSLASLVIISYYMLSASKVVKEA